MSGEAQTRRDRVRSAVGRGLGKLLGSFWEPRCGLCSWKAEFSVIEDVTSCKSYGYACADHLVQMVRYSTNGGLPCRVEPAKGYNRAD